MRYISSKLNLGSDSARLYKIGALNVTEINVYKSYRYHGCEFCTSLSSTTTCPAKYKGKASVARFVYNFTEDAIDNPPYCIMVNRTKYKKSLFLMSYIKQFKDDN